MTEEYQPEPDQISEQLTQSDLDAVISLLMDANNQNAILQNEIEIKNDKILQLIDAKQIIEDALISALNTSDKSIERYEEIIEELKQKITIKNRIIRKLYKDLKQYRE